MRIFIFYLLSFITLCSEYVSALLSTKQQSLQQLRPLLANSANRCQQQFNTTHQAAILKTIYTTY